ncbi:50S ribosomal protein L30 [Fusobacterium sp. MFO224]|uniref:50S ribosomal protein L30 n=1 Tax=Fusobacterium sp. MFO224 TaxID=3378070 RepID=UPI003851E7B6
MAKVKIRLAKSIIGRKPNHIATIKSLGLKKMNSVAEHEATPDIMGKIALVSYLLDVEEVQ